MVLVYVFSSRRHVNTDQSGVCGVSVCQCLVREKNKEARVDGNVCGGGEKETGGERLESCTVLFTVRVYLLCWRV